MQKKNMHIYRFSAVQVAGGLPLRGRGAGVPAPGVPPGLWLGPGGLEAAAGGRSAERRARQAERIYDAFICIVHVYYLFVCCYCFIVIGYYDHCYYCYIVYSLYVMVRKHKVHHIICTLCMYIRSTYIGLQWYIRHLRLTYSRI